MNATNQRGPIAWMVRNRVAPNLLAAVLLVGGVIAALRVKKEIFPEFDLDTVRVTVAYPGASPEEVEQGVLLAVEEQVRGVDGVKRVTGLAFEGSGLVQAELRLGGDPEKALGDIRNAVDRIGTFPQEAERPIVSLATNRRHVVSLILHGDLEERALRDLAEQTREELLRDERVTLVDIVGVRRPEISIEPSQAELRAHGLTIDEIAAQVKRASVQLPGGSLKTGGGEVLLRTDERRDAGRQFADIAVISGSDGTQVPLGRIARITDGFEDTSEKSFFNGRRAAMLRVYRVGSQTPTEVSKAVHECEARLGRTLPAGVSATIWMDDSTLYRERMDLLMRNAQMGLLLVIVILGLFLEARIAFWVTWGIPTAFLGAMLLMPLLGVTINIISLFAFIMALGMVVDDAIVVGENISDHRRLGKSWAEAAIAGTREVAMPVVFSVLTNVVAFLPLFLVPGMAGKVFRAIPLIMTAVFGISLLEALFVFPSHVGHGEARREGWLAWLGAQRARFGDWVMDGLARLYRPVARVALRHRYLNVALWVALLALSVGWVAGGRINFDFLGRTEFDVTAAMLVMPQGIPVEQTEAAQERLALAARDVVARNGGDRICKGIFTQVGFAPEQPGLGDLGIAAGGGHLGAVQVQLVPADQRSLTMAEFTRQWRQAVGEMPGAESLMYQYAFGPTGGAPIDVQLSHPDRATLERAATSLAGSLRSFSGVADVDDGFAPGKPQLSFKVRPEARSLGLTPAGLGRQVRSAFYGAEALRQQRGRDELKVMVRLPAEERRSEQAIESLTVRTPAGGEMELREAADVRRSRAPTEIRRVDGRRVINVTADVDPRVANAEKVVAELKRAALPALSAGADGLTWSLEGQQRETRDVLRNLGYGAVLALLLIYALLAIPLRSHVQGLIILAAVPFAAIGALAGHVLMGMDLSVVSLMGLVALGGVAVNDSLVLICATNERREKGAGAFDSAADAGARRLRPILLTSLTTFFGLAPLVFENSVQARLISPMAVSLAWGVLFGTFVSLFLVPALYMIMEDVRGLVCGTGGKAKETASNVQLSTFNAQLSK